MIWTACALVTVVCSWLGTALLVRKLYHDWDFRISSVRALFLLFFIYLWLYATARAVFYAWLLSLPRDQVVDVDPHNDGTPLLTYEELDRLGIHSIQHLRGASNPWVVITLLFGDAAHFGITVWAVPLVYELSWLVRQSMDRGAVKERARTHVYAIVGHTAIASFLIVDIVLALTSGGHIGYTPANHDCLLFVYVSQIASLAYMIAMLILLKVRGRKYETIHGEFVLSPVYKRLQHIMFVYLLFALQFQVASLIIFASNNTQDSAILAFIGVSLMMYNATGFALAVTTGCSQTCVFKYCGACIPDDVEAQLVHGGPLQFATPLTTPFFDSTTVHMNHIGLSLDGIGAAVESYAPSVDPVFVFTDIESSSALWGMSNGHTMRKATELHDSILRGLLAKYRGYEITTAGDAFQLAFHSIREASSYCLDAQLQLTLAKWPRELHGLVPATARVYAGSTRRRIFNGLRVRMGIHDASRSEGALVVDIHAVTGKTTYTGASEVIANEIGDLGAGGQIFVTQRVAHWLETNAAIMDIAYNVARVGPHSIPQVNVTLELFQLVPQLLSQRMKHFSARRLVRTETLYSLVSDRSMRGTTTATGRSNVSPASPGTGGSIGSIGSFHSITSQVRKPIRWVPHPPSTPPPQLMDVDEHDDDNSEDGRSRSSSTNAYALVSWARRQTLETVHTDD